MLLDQPSPEPYPTAKLQVIPDLKHSCWRDGKGREEGAYDALTPAFIFRNCCLPDYRRFDRHLYAEHVCGEQRTGADLHRTA